LRHDRLRLLGRTTRRDLGFRRPRSSRAEPVADFHGYGSASSPMSRATERPSMSACARATQSSGVKGSSPELRASSSCSSARGGAAVREAAVVVPILPGTHEAARVLVEHGPPFDPAAVGLERHQVLLTTDEVVFLFESHLGEPALEALLAEPALLEIAAEWQ